MTTMKAIIAILALALLVIACAKAPEVQKQDSPSEIKPEATTPDSPAVTAISSDVTGVDDLSKDMDTSGLDSLDEDLSDIDSMPLG